MIGHSLERTSLFGEDFIGTCTLCGTEGLKTTAVFQECPNPRGVSSDDAVVNAIIGEQTETEET